MSTKRLFTGLAGSPLAVIVDVPQTPAAPMKRKVGRPRGTRTAADRKRDWRAKKKLQAEQIKQFEELENRPAPLPWALIHTGGFDPANIGQIADHRQLEENGSRKVYPKGSNPDPDAITENAETDETFTDKIKYSKRWINGGPDKQIDRGLFLDEVPSIYITEEEKCWQPSEGSDLYSGWVCHAENCGLASSTKRIAVDHLLREHSDFLEREFKRYFRTRRKAFRESQVASTSKNGTEIIPVKS